MKALLLEDVRRFELRDIPKPIAGETEVLVRVGAVGMCGTDLHIFHGLANYNRDSREQLIALRQHAGSKVTKVVPGDRVVVDQDVNCGSPARSLICEYCETGDSHECEFGE